MHQIVAFEAAAQMINETWLLLAMDLQIYKYLGSDIDYIHEENRPFCNTANNWYLETRLVLSGRYKHAQQKC
jgi:hypothetical protein